MYDGIINVYKEKGFTSHDAVAKLRGILGQRKVGHTGTLDPAAEGVLPICAGKGTRLCDMLTDHDKEYRAVLLLGAVTDTQDTTGEVLARSDACGLSEAAVQEAVLSFEGGYDQIPPMYSALRVNGRRLYELAREGKEVERQARPVKLYKIAVEEISLPEVRFRVSCSKGTYIRTLCHDIGKRLGVGGCMKELCRLRVGRFAAEDAKTLSELQAFKDTGRLSEAVIPLEAVFAELPELRADGETMDRLIRNGNPFRYAGKGPFAPGAAVRVYDKAGTFTGVYEYSEEKTMFCPRKIFLGGN
ncbi:MAG: tRNA pseudouridine(55) synthase TruB [Lachnospiraceae bacterium]|nr:tRNA pseudouridine(55) synthase TruB [Lachnospiraceae bacterium]